MNKKSINSKSTTSSKKSIKTTSSKKSIKTTSKSKVVLTSEEIAMEAISMRNQGYTYQEIATSLNVDISKVYRAVYNYNRKTNVPVRNYTKSSTKSSMKKTIKKADTSSKIIPNTNTAVTSTSTMSFWSTIKYYITMPFNVMFGWFSK